MPTSYAVIKERKENDPEYAAKLKSYAEKYRENNSDKEKERQRKSKSESRAKDREAYNAYMREWTRKNKDKINAVRRELRKSDPERARKDNEKRRENRNPLMHRDTMLRNNYGMSLDDYYQKYVSQDGKCAICGEKKPSSGRDGLAVDHCHTKGHVRGLLCIHCNHGLGKFKDNPDLLQKAIEYLKERGES